MGWLTGFWTKEGKGIPADAPKSRGLKLFGEIVWRELWDLFMLNLLIVVFSLPLITAPAAHVAATQVAAQMVKDQNVWLFKDFWRGFRAALPRATLAGLAVLLLLLAMSYAVWIWGQASLRDASFAAPLLISLVIFGLFLMWSAQLFVLISQSPLPVKDLLRPALAAMLIRPLPLLGAAGFIALLWLLHILFYPVSAFMPAVINFSLSVLALTFAGLPATKQVLRSDAQAFNECLTSAPAGDENRRS